MKIIILSSVHPPLDVRVYYKQAISLTHAGHDVTLIAKYDEKAKKTIASQCIKYVPLSELPGGRLARPYLWLQMIQLLKKIDADVWHFHDPELLPLAILTKRILSKRVSLIYDVHEDLPKDILEKPWIPGFLRKIISVLADKVEKWGIRNCQQVIAATDSIFLRVSSVTDCAVTVHNYPIRNNNSHNRSIEKKSTDKIRVIYSGILIPTRGIREIVEAMNLLDSRKIELFLLGDFYPKEFENQIKKISGSSIHILGKVPFEDVSDYLESSDIGIVCFHPLPNHVEAMPNKIFEYMQAGLPVIASDFPLWRKIIEEGKGCGIVVNPQDPEEIASAIQKLAKDENLRKSMGEEGARLAAEKYSWESESLVLLEVYKSLEDRHLT